MNTFSNIQDFPIRRQTFNGVDLESNDVIIEIKQFESPKMSRKTQICPGAPERNLRPFIHTNIEINPLVLNFDSDNEEEERISPPPNKRRRVVITPGAPIKETSTQSRLSEAISQSLVPIILNF
jgi:hypothetical protein